MGPHKKCYKRKQPQTDDEQTMKKKYRKINAPTCNSNNNPDNCVTSRHELLVDLIQQTREDYQQSSEVFNRPSTSKDNLKNKCIQEVQNDMNEIDVVDIRKRKLARMWMQKQNLEKKIDEKMQEQEVFNQENTKSVELSLAMTAVKVQEMEKHRRSQLNKLLTELKEYSENNWKLMYMLYQSQQENEDLKISLRNLHKRTKHQKLSCSWKRRESAFEERKTEAVVNCTLILICAYILYHLAIDVVQRMNPNQMLIEEIEASPSENQEVKEILEE